MNRPKVQRNPQRLHFVTSAVDLQGCPRDDFPEVAIVGRSNAGKSTLINGLGHSKIAQVSSTPGKTRLLNFYQCQRYRLVDMPGYGFSSRSGGEQSSWQGMIEPFLARRKNLVGLLLVMDIRRDWSEDEENLLDWLTPRELPLAVILTKADKLGRNEISKRVAQVRAQAAIDEVLVTSSLKKQGYDEIDDFLFVNWLRPEEES